MATGVALGARPAALCKNELGLDVAVEKIRIEGRVGHLVVGPRIDRRTAKQGQEGPHGRATTPLGPDAHGDDDRPAESAVATIRSPLTRHPNASVLPRAPCPHAPSPPLPAA